MVRVWHAGPMVPLPGCNILRLSHSPGIVQTASSKFTGGGFDGLEASRFHAPWRNVL